MSLERLFEITEPVYRAEEGQRARFRLDRIPVKKGNLYIVSFIEPLTDDEAQRVVSLADAETVKVMEDLEDDDTHYQGDSYECRFTHTLEHLAVCRLTRMNPFAAMRLRSGEIKGGHSTHGVLRADPNTNIYSFKVNPEIAPRPDLEIASVRKTCGEVASLLT